MSDRVLIPLGPIGTLLLTREAYEAALAAGAALATSPEPSRAAAPPNLMSAEAMEAATGVPASWFATQARERRIPFRKLGRYVRFDFAEVMDSEAMQRRAIPPGQLNCTGSLDRKGRASA
jgi:hypothetical protein